MENTGTTTIIVTTTLIVFFKGKIVMIIFPTRQFKHFSVTRLFDFFGQLVYSVEPALNGH